MYRKKKKREKLSPSVDPALVAGCMCLSAFRSISGSVIGFPFSLSLSLSFSFSLSVRVPLAFLLERKKERQREREVPNSLEVGYNYH